MLTRRTALGVGGAALVAAHVRTAKAQGVTLRFAHEAPETAIKGRSAKMLAELVARHTNGAVTINVFPGAQLVPTTEELRAAVRGQVDIIAPYSSYFSAIDPAWDIFFQPFLFESVQQAFSVFSGETGRTLLGRLESRGLRGLSIWQDGPVYAFTKGDPATTPESLRGRRVRVAPSRPIESMLQRIGAASISMPATEVYLALQQGVVQGVITTPTFAAPARWGEVLTTMTRALWGVGGYGLAMNRRSWDRLEPAQREGFMRAVTETEQWNLQQTIENIGASERTLAGGGMSIHDISAEQREAWAALARPVWAAQPEEVRALMGRVRG